MKKTALSILSLAFTLSVVAQSTWTLDKAHAKLGFGITHMMVSEVEGAFKSFDVKVTSTKGDLTDSKIELTADATSISTDNDDRDKHLKNADFFDVEKFPTLTFKSTEFKQVDGKKYKLTGNLTMHGATRWVTLDVKFNGTTIHPYSKKTVAGFKITGTLKRSDFGIGTKFGDAMLSDEVELDVNVELVKD
jgi:polyisoprenoid-binding protein YceI